MSYLKNLNSERLDLLKELGNIGAGNAVTSLSKMLSKPIDMQVPQINIVDFKDIAAFVDDPENIIAGILVNLSGDINGIMMFIMTLDSARTLTNNLLGTNNCDEDFSEMELSALTEIGNIVSGSYLGSLSSIINKRIIPSVPSLSIDMANAVLSLPAILFSRVADKVLLIESLFSIENDKFSGFFVLVPDMESFDVIFSVLT